MIGAPRTSAGRLAAVALGFFAATAALSGAVPSPRELLDVQAGVDRGVVRIDARIKEGWHVNSHTPSEDYLIPTAVSLDPAAGVRFGPPRYPAGVSKKFAFSDKPLSVYENRFTIEVPVETGGVELPPLSGKIDFQACNDSQCLAPASIAFRTSGSAAPALGGGAVPLSAAPPDGAASTGAAGASRDFGDTLARRGLGFVLLLLFVGGLALNLTPCVYPVIPLTIGFFGGQSKGEGGRVLGLAALYVLGMATMYSTLGVAAALSGKLFGAALQSPWVVAGVAAILVLLALSMFGFYEIRMPSSWMQKAGARAGGAGAYGMGLLVGVVAAPCVGPFVLGLLAFVAARQNAALGFLFFFVLSLGLGLPYVFLALFSGSISRLPRAGEWMEGIKKIFGWVLIAMAAYFLRTVVPWTLGGWLLPAVLLAAAVALLLRSGPLRPPLRVAASVLFLAAAIFFVPRATPAAETDWKPYSSAAISSAGRPVLIDFSAAWCAPCRELDEKTLADPRVRRALAGRELYKADLTRTNSPETQELSRRYAILGVPTIIFLDPSGRERTDLRLVGFEGPEAFLARVQKAP